MSGQAPNNACFTLNNYAKGHLDALRHYVDKGELSYICWGFEVGASGTPHLQGYCEVPTGKRMKFDKMKKLLFGSHIEKRMGTCAQAVDYCKGICEKKKNNDLNVFEEYGEVRDDNRTKECIFRAAIDKVKKGTTLAELVDETPVLCRYMSSLKTIVKEFTPYVPKKPIKCLWYWGPAGAGKTHHAFYESGYKEEEVYLVNCSMKWCDGYKPTTQKCVLFDDYGEDVAPEWRATGLKQLLDKYGGNVQEKGGVLAFRPECVIFTSAYHPSMYLSGNDENVWRQIERRFEEIVEVQHTEESLARLKALAVKRERRIGGIAPKPICPADEYLEGTANEEGQKATQEKDIMHSVPFLDSP